MSAIVIIVIVVMVALLILAYIPLKEYVDDDNNLVIKLFLTMHISPWIRWN